MRIPVKGLVRTAGRFLRRNDTKILAVVGRAATVVAMGLAVKAGMKANEKIKEAEIELKEENPDAELKTSEKAKIIAKEVAPATVVAVGGVVADSFLIKCFSKRVATATAMAEFYTAPPHVVTSLGKENKEGDCETIKAEISPSFSESWNNRFTDIKFDVYEPLSKQLIKDVTIDKLYRAELVANHFLISEREMALDWIVGMLGGHELEPRIKGRYVWECPVDGYGYSFADYTCSIVFKPCLDTVNNRLILLFDNMPKWIGPVDETPERPKTTMDNVYII